MLAVRALPIQIHDLDGAYTPVDEMEESISYKREFHETGTQEETINYALTVEQPGNMTITMPSNYFTMMVKSY